MKREIVEKNKHLNRIDKIIFIYHFYLFEYKDSEIIDKAMDLEKWNFSKDDLAFFECFSKQRKAVEKYAQQFLSKKWTFDRLEPLIKAIVAHSIIEIMNFDIDKSIVINEAVIICKKFSYEKASPMVNAVLDKVNKKEA